MLLVLPGVRFAANHSAYAATRADRDATIREITVALSRATAIVKAL